MHRKTLEQIFRIFETSEKGLSQTEIKKKQEKHGLNIIVTKKKKNLFLQFLEEFKDLLVIILIVAAIFAAIAGEVRDTWVILFIVVLNAAIGFIQKYRAEKALEALQKMIAPRARVIREGKEQMIDAKELVPGDILILNEGDQVTADSRLIEVAELSVSEATLTGESIPVSKQTEPIDKRTLGLDEHENIVFMGTNVTHGSGKAVVIRTGMKTEFGKIAHLTSETKKDKSPLQKELARIGSLVGEISIAICVFLFLIGFFLQGKSFAETFLFATAVAVAAVPEGLPATITIALALGVQRLARKKAIVKQLASAETLGSTTVICSDKTGTLTKNEMTVKEILTEEYEIFVHGAGYEPKGGLYILGEKSHFSISREYSDRQARTSKFNLQTLAALRKEFFVPFDLLNRCAVLCNNARFQIKKGRGAATQWEMLGDPTEGALLAAAVKAGFDREKVSKEHQRIGEIPFDSKRKRMTTINQEAESKKMIAYVKGAPDRVLDLCTKIYWHGKIIPLSPAQKQKILVQTQKMAEKALRVLAFAYRELPEKISEELVRKKTGSAAPLNASQVEKDLIYLGMMGMHDPARPEVYEAVKLTQKAGIKVYVITGDYGPTAEAIARQIGLIRTKKPKILTGAILAKMSEKKLIGVFRKNAEIIFARVSPEHKLKIVSALKKCGEIVAMTGDGVNDAPALKRSDIGVAMGIAGTDVSKEAASVVLADDSFGTIVTAVKEGRTIYNNLKKFVFYILSCNTGELAAIFVAILLNIPMPLTAILILCVNLGTDVFPALALGVDPGEPGIMEKPPHDPKVHIVRKAFIYRFFYLGLFISLLVTGMYLWTLSRYGWNFGEALSEESLTYLKGTSVAFALLVWIQIVNAFNARSEEHSIFKLGFLSNRWLLGAVFISFLLVLAIIEIPFLQTYLHTTSLAFKEWLLVVFASLSILLIEEVRKKLLPIKA